MTADRAERFAWWHNRPMTDYLERARHYHVAIRTILLTEWDPVGVSHIPEAQDEYDSYVGGVYKLLITHVDSIHASDVGRDEHQSGDVYDVGGDHAEPDSLLPSTATTTAT